MKTYKAHKNFVVNVLSMTFFMLAVSGCGGFELSGNSPQALEASINDISSRLDDTLDRVDRVSLNLNPYSVVNRISVLGGQSRYNGLFTYLDKVIDPMVNLLRHTYNELDETEAIILKHMQSLEGQGLATDKVYKHYNDLYIAVKRKKKQLKEKGYYLTSRMESIDRAFDKVSNKLELTKPLEAIALIFIENFRSRFSTYYDDVSEEIDVIFDDK